MTSLFSIFDPQAIWGLPLNWSAAAIFLAILPSTFWVSKSQSKMTLTKLTQYLTKEFKAIVGPAAIPGLLLLSVSVFMFIFVNNFMGLAPYIFTASSHLTLTLSLAVPMWVGHTAYGWANSSSHMFAHLVPLGSPAVLAPFMVVIELVSAVIRPLTLAVRLAANMVAGHLLMVLLSSPMTKLPFLVLSCVLAALVLLAVLESAVATIQAYVFSVLTVLYVNEVAPIIPLKSKTTQKVNTPT